MVAQTRFSVMFVARLSVLLMLTDSVAGGHKQFSILAEMGIFFFFAMSVLV
jgi:hypothetical protein